MLQLFELQAEKPFGIGGARVFKTAKEKTRRQERTGQRRSQEQHERARYQIGPTIRHGPPRPRVPCPLAIRAAESVTGLALGLARSDIDTVRRSRLCLDPKIGCQNFCLIYVKFVLKSVHVSGLMMDGRVGYPCNLLHARCMLHANGSLANTMRHPYQSK